MVAIIVSLIVPDAAVLVGMLMLGNLMKECGVVDRLSKTVQNELMNNVVIFPGIFKGALEGRATAITEDMKLAAATAIADLVPPEKLCDDFILPEAFDPQVSEIVSQAVKKFI